MLEACSSLGISNQLEYASQIEEFPIRTILSRIEHFG